MRVEHCLSENFKSVENVGYLRLNFVLPAVIDSGQLIFKYFEYE
jgi:hypothetical protein